MYPARFLALGALAALALAPVAPLALEAQPAAPVFVRLSAEKDSATARQLITLTYRWHQAVVDDDTVALKDILAEDYVLLGPDLERAITPRKPYLKNVKAYRISSFSFPKLDVHLTGDLAVVTSQYEQDAIVGGVPRSGHFFMTDVWRRDGTGWRVHSRASTWLDRPAAPPAPSVPTVTLSSAELRRYVGTYMIEDGRTVRMVERDGTLSGVSEGYPTGRRLVPVGNDTFVFPDHPETRTVFTVENGRAVRFVRTNGEQTLARGERVP